MGKASSYLVNLRTSTWVYTNAILYAGVDAVGIRNVLMTAPCKDEIRITLGI